MIALVFLFAFLGAIGFAVHLIGAGEFYEAFKALVAAGGLFTLLAVRISFFRVTHGR